MINKFIPRVLAQNELKFMNVHVGSGQINALDVIHYSASIIQLIHHQCMYEHGAITQLYNRSMVQAL